MQTPLTKPSISPKFDVEIKMTNPKARLEDLSKERSKDLIETRGLKKQPEWKKTNIHRKDIKLTLSPQIEPRDFSKESKELTKSAEKVIPIFGTSFVTSFYPKRTKPKRYYY